MNDKMTLREFWKREGFTMPQALYLAEHGLIEGAQLNPFSKKWSIEEPARLVGWLHALAKSKPQAEKLAPKDLKSQSQSLRAARLSRAGVMEAIGRNGDTHSMLLALQAGAPLLEDGFAVSVAGGSACGDGGQRDGLPGVFSSPKVLNAARSVSLAARGLFYPVVLSGAQILAIERALARELEAIDERSERHEFEPEAEFARKAEEDAVHAALVVLRRATTDKHRASQERAGFQI